jgi:hypothetical protein
MTTKNVVAEWTHKMPITTEQRDRMNKYLLAKMNGPQYEDEQASRNNLGAALMKSAAQIGSFGGHMADASPVADFAKAQNAELAGRERSGLQNMSALADLEAKGNNEYLDTEKQRIAEAKNTADATRLAAKEAADQAFQNNKLTQDAKLAADKIAADKALQSQKLAAERAATKDKALADAGKPKEEKPPTEGQANYADYGTRMAAATKVADDVMTSGYNPATVSVKNVAAKLPVVSNLAMSPSARVYMTAKRDFISGVLRKQSGATISDQEFAREDEKYFPQLGDDRQTMNYKAALRKQAAENYLALGGKPASTLKGAEFAFKPPAQSGTAMAAPAPQPTSPPPGRKDPKEMSDEELKAELGIK